MSPSALEPRPWHSPRLKLVDQTRNLPQFGRSCDGPEFLRCRCELDFILRQPPIEELEFVKVEEAAAATILPAWNGIARQLNRLRGGELNFTPMRSGIDICSTMAANFMADYEDHRDDVWRIFLERIVSVSLASGSEVENALEFGTFLLHGNWHP